MRKSSQEPQAECTLDDGRALGHEKPADSWISTRNTSVLFSEGCTQFSATRSGNGVLVLPLVPRIPAFISSSH